MGLFDGLFGPKAPSAAELLEQQKQASLFNFGLVNPNQTLATGDARTVTRTGDTFNVVDQFGPLNQTGFDLGAGLRNDLFGLGQTQAGQAVDSLGTPLGGAPQFGDFSGDAATNAFFDQQIQLLTPGFEEARRFNTQNLAGSGFQLGSEGFETSTNLVNDAENRARRQSARDAIIFGGSEGRLNFNSALQGFGADITARQNPLLNALSIAQGIPTPGNQFFGTQAVQGVSALDANALALNQANTRAGNASGFLGNLIGTGGNLGAASILSQGGITPDAGLFSFGGGAAGTGAAASGFGFGSSALPLFTASDRRLKTGIKRIDYPFNSYQKFFAL